MLYWLEQNQTSSQSNNWLDLKFLTIKIMITIHRVEQEAVVHKQLEFQTWINIHIYWVPKRQSAYFQLRNVGQLWLTGEVHSSRSHRAHSSSGYTEHSTFPSYPTSSRNLRAKVSGRSNQMRTFCKYIPDHCIQSIGWQGRQKRLLVRNPFQDIFQGSGN